MPSDVPIPGVYPSTSPDSPPPVGAAVVPDFGPAWAAAHAKAQALTADWSIDDKVKTVTGVFWMNGRCVGNIAAVNDWPGLCLEDSPLGVRDTDFVTAFPAGITTATTWNRTLIRARGQAMGAEFKGKGANVALGPMMNMGRIAQGGRNWEGFGADPYLTGESAYETILGMQESGAQACAKHYINKCAPFSLQLSVAPMLMSGTASRSTGAHRSRRTSTTARSTRSTCTRSCARSWPASRA